MLDELMREPLPGQAGRLPERIVSHDPERPNADAGKIYPPVRGGWRLFRAATGAWYGPFGWGPVENAAVFATEDEARALIASGQPRALFSGAEPKLEATDRAKLAPVHGGLG